MIKKLILVLAVTLLAALPAAVFAHPGGPGSPVGPPAGSFWANDVEYMSVITPAHVPDEGEFDILYIFPGCMVGEAECAPVSDAAQGYGEYNGGRWAVVAVSGITEQLTSAAAVLAAVNASEEDEIELEDTGHRFVCPLIKKVGSE